MSTTEPLSKVDSAVQGLSSSPKDTAKEGKRRASSSVPGVFNINDLGMSSAFLTGASGRVRQASISQCKRELTPI
jgi:hypothetical protein